MKTYLKRLPLALMVSGGLAAVVLTYPPDRAPVAWTKERLQLTFAQLGYKTEWVDNRRYPDSYAQGLYLARQTDPRSWQEIASRRPKTRAGEFWLGLVVVSHDFLNSDSSDVWQRHGPSQMRLGRLLFSGDPSELDRIATYLQP